jgi:hypothetical protein
MTPDEFRAQYPTHTGFRNRCDGSDDNLVGYNATHVAVLCGGCEYSWPLADAGKVRVDPNTLPVVNRMIELGIHEATFGIEENQKREFWVNGEFALTMVHSAAIEPSPGGVTAEHLPPGMTIEQELEWVVQQRVAMCTHGCVVFRFDDNKSLVVGCDGRDAMAFKIYTHCGSTTRRYGVCPWVATYCFDGVGCAEVAAAVYGIREFGLYDILPEDMRTGVDGLPLTREERRMRLGFDGFTVKRANAWVVAMERAAETLVRM